MSRLHELRMVTRTWEGTKKRERGEKGTGESERMGEEGKQGKESGGKRVRGGGDAWNIVSMKT